MSRFPIDRLLSMSSMTALARVREYAGTSGVSFQDAVVSLRRFDAEYQSLDFDAAADLDAFVENIAFDTFESFYRLTLRRVVEREMPLWIRLASAGRSRLCGSSTREYFTVLKSSRFAR